MILTSPSFEDQGAIPKKFTCDGGDINPELQIQNVPPDARSLALILHDHDAPLPGGFTHWIAWNISPLAAFIKEESAPPGALEGTNSAGKEGYIGPCPPSGAHRYEFRLYALDVELPLAAAADRSAFEAAIAGHVLEEASLTGIYARQ